jgi:glutathione S-transferase
MEMMNRGEFVRLTLVACKANWEDERISFIDYFMNGRRDEMPNKKVPVLVVNG